MKQGKLIVKKDLKEGNILPIYLNFKNQENYRGDAVLIKRLCEREPSFDQRIFEFSEIENIYDINRIHNKIQVLYNYQWWKIKFITGPEKDFTTAVKIAYYYKKYWQKNDE